MSVSEDHAAVIEANRQVARLYADLQNRHTAVLNAIYPFVQAYKMHSHYPVQKLKERVTLSISLQDWEKLIQVMEGQNEQSADR